MRAIHLTKHDKDLATAYQLETNAVMPEISDNEVLIRVDYAALNRLDDFVRLGWPGLNLHFPHVPCADFAGTIEKVGAHAGSWQPGQRVTANPLLWSGEDDFVLRGEQNRSRASGLVGEHFSGTCAAFIKLPARNLIEIPVGFNIQKAAAASLVYVTAWHSLITAGRLIPGEKVLIVGAGGGVNTAALQIARMVGAQTFVIASTAEKAQKASEIGADWVHDRSADPRWSKAVYLATDKEGIDMVVDNVGAVTWDDSLRTLRPGGRLVTVGGTSGYEAKVNVGLIFHKHLSIIGSTMGTHDDYKRVMGLVFQNKLDPVIDAVFSMEDFTSAMQRMLAGRHFGKILIKVSP
ncbi:MAG: alcohol dehydrogenase [Calditrichaeota bacterium]|nr:MAG: alcohol dehydrogenase [Calditrichota bacterium]